MLRVPPPRLLVSVNEVNASNTQHEAISFGAWIPIKDAMDDRPRACASSALGARAEGYHILLGGRR